MCDGQRIISLPQKSHLTRGIFLTSNLIQHTPDLLRPIDDGSVEAKPPKLAYPSLLYWACLLPRRLNLDKANFPVT